MLMITLVALALGTAAAITVVVVRR